MALHDPIRPRLESFVRVNLRTAAAVGEVQEGTVRKWVQRGHIGCYDGEYETTEILLWVEQTRKTDQVIGAMKTAHGHHQRRTD